MTDLYIVNTHFQLVNSINLAFNRQDNFSYLYINTFAFKSEFIRRIRGFQLFNQIFPFYEEYTNEDSFEAGYISHNISYFKTFSPSVKIDDFFYSNDNPAVNALFYNCKRSNENIQINYVEDGLFSYINHSVKYDLPASRLDANDVASLHFLQEDKFYLYEPELSLFSTEKIYSLPKLTYELVDKMAQIYELTDEILCGLPSLIYLGQPFLLSDEVNLFKWLQSNYLFSSERDYAVKSHPRTLDGDYAPDIQILGKSYPIEILLLLSPKREFTIVSLFSSPALTLHTMFDRSYKRFNTIIMAQLLLSKEIDAFKTDNMTQDLLENLKSVNLMVERYNNSIAIKSEFEKIQNPYNREDLKSLLRR